MQMAWFIIIHFQNLRVNKIKDIEERKEKQFGINGFKGVVIR